MLLKSNEDWYFDNIRFEIPIGSTLMQIETLRLFYPRENSNPHWHLNYEMHILLEGAISFNIDGHENILLEENQILLIPPRMVHSETIKRNALGVILGFNFVPFKKKHSTREIDSEMEVLISVIENYSDRPYYSLNGAALLNMFKMLYNELKLDQVGCLINAQNYLTQALIYLCRNMAGKPMPRKINFPYKRPEDDTLFIISEYFNIDTKDGVKRTSDEALDLSLKGLANALCMSESQTSRFLLKTYGKTFITLMNETKISHAKYLLSSTNLPVHIIAEKCGWSEKYLSRYFKSKVGTSPLKYRKIYISNS